MLYRQAKYEKQNYRKESSVSQEKSFLRPNLSLTPTKREDEGFSGVEDYELKCE
jgi:hypothetical protein